MIEIKICPVCEGNDLLPFLICLDHSVSLEKFNLVQCQNCDLILTSPRPENELIGQYYNSESYTSHLHKSLTLLDKIYMFARHFTLKWKLELVDKNTQSQSNQKRILDFGCGTGQFLAASEDNGWRVYGVEPSKTARNNASPTVKNHISISMRELPGNVEFDAITLWHVLEHVPDLTETIQTLKNKLSPHGTIFIAVPNNKSWDARIYKQNWAAYDVPRHLWHFSKKNMRLLLNHHALKLVNIIPMRLDAFYISLLSEKYAGSGKFKAFTNAVLNGFRSNYFARKNEEYSSLIYIVKK